MSDAKSGQKFQLKYGFHKKYFQKNEPLTSWTLFSPVFFQISADSVLIWKKRGKKVFNWTEVHFFGSISYEIHILIGFPKTFDNFLTCCKCMIGHWIARNYPRSKVVNQISFCEFTGIQRNMWYMIVFVFKNHLLLHFC